MRNERFVWGSEDIQIVNKESISKSNSQDEEKETNLALNRKNNLGAIKQAIKTIEKAENL